ncbi:MAG: lipoate--protein ligase family protein [Halanaeroarchaeum sp.]
MDLLDGDWRLIREERRSGPMQMALDEIAARTAGDGGPRTVRVYTWSPTTLSLGYRQDPATVDWERCEREGTTVTRRQTGGGGIYHDAYGDISYSIVAPAADLPGDLMESYEILMEPVFDAFDRMGVPATYVSSKRPALYEPACYLRDLHPAHDVVVDGRKISGNAQYRQREAVIQHGSLSYALDPDAHRGVFTDVPVDEDAFRDRITSIGEVAKIDRPTAVKALEAALESWAGAREGAWTDAEIDAATSLAEEKYGSPDWNRDRSDTTN